MSTLKLGGRFVSQEELNQMEQRRLAALLEIQEKHAREISVAETSYRELEEAHAKLQQTLDAFRQEQSGALGELKRLREINPERIKKQVKRLQVQNRQLTTENRTVKQKLKEAGDRIKSLKEELATSREEETSSA
jgi:chromosome segregation ATPase